jgi:putative DNA methylase
LDSKWSPKFILAFHKKSNRYKKTDEKNNMKAIEIDFPFEKIDAIAEIESWRKEAIRPIYHLHKWWARRLGSVFRAIVLGVILDEDQDIWAEYYETHRFDNITILDPFMGSGTTLGECAKLGVRTIGCDANPVSTFIVRQALTPVKEADLLTTFHELERNVADKIKSYYKTIDPETGQECDVLYYFWVKMVKTPSSQEIPLFKRYVFSKSIYPKKDPTARILCPQCWQVNFGFYDDVKFQCVYCKHQFNPQQGSATEQYVLTHSGKQYKIKEIVPKYGVTHRLYAIMALNPQGKRIYLTPTQFDHDLFKKAQQDCQNDNLLIPQMKIRSCQNTQYAVSYGYQFWHQLFNERQQLCLSLLLKSILQIPDSLIREQFLCLFSTTLKFNNLYCSFKGEDTGAIRHIFYHSLLNLEKTPIENNLWGNKVGSGTFLNFFKSKLLKAKKYLEEPSEIYLEYDHKKGRKTSRKSYCNHKVDLTIVDTYDAFIKEKNTALIMNGDSATLPLPDNSVDAIVTDPPYFDLIHYSELSDFFYAWLQLALKDTYDYFKPETSSHSGEVQNRDQDKFMVQLTRVFSECFRVIKENGLMVFSFHHLLPKAWLSIYQAITQAQFVIVAAYPVKAEMLGNKIKPNAKTAIYIDALIVCKKQPQSNQPKYSQLDDLWLQAKKTYYAHCKRFEKVGRMLSEGEKYVILASLLLVNSSLSHLNAANTLQLLEKAHELDFSTELEEEMEQSMTEEISAKMEIEKKTTLTEQTSFPF